MPQSKTPNATASQCHSVTAWCVFSSKAETQESHRRTPQIQTPPKTALICPRIASLPFGDTQTTPARETRSERKRTGKLKFKEF